MKREMTIVMFALSLGIIHQAVAHNVEAVMYLDTEMPCLSSELLSGKIVICNKGEEEVKLMKSAVALDDYFVHEQLYLFPDIPLEEEKMIGGDRGGLGGQPSRATIKENTDYEVQRNEHIITLKKGESFEVAFDRRRLEASALFLHGGGKRRIPFAAELYLSPDVWIPVEVRPPIAVAFDAKAGTPVKEGKWINGNEPWVWRVRIDTNEFLFVKTDSASPTYRLGEVHPDDTVTHSNKVITITRKDGSVRAIPEAEIPRVSAERKEEIRKNRQPETKN